ncbi:thermonuclease family protein [Bauldia sp.]|uniref:thermonuclease family protein n=1 Tax=Bauldia sp. TaxID=2575872 RepID=UPI003BA981AF
MNTARSLLLAIAATVAVVCEEPALARDEIAGPVAAKVMKVVDGDTVTVEAAIWIGQRLTVNARIRGIDAPEIRGKCDVEKRLAEDARHHLEILAATEPVWLSRIADDKYAGRVVADVTLADGTDIGTEMIAAGYARAYDGGSRRSWCTADLTAS